MIIMSNFYVTTPIYYVNGKPHIGHAYTTIAADALARYHRGHGVNVFFSTGTDEHGQKIAKEADGRGISPQTLIDNISQNFVKLWDVLAIDYSAFIRTTDPLHINKVQEFLQKLYDKGDIYKGNYEGWYCVSCETFVPEGQAEEGVCQDCGQVIEKLKEKSYFFCLSKYQDWLVDYIKKKKLVTPQTRQNEILGFLKEPLEDLCISRPQERLSWGIPLPFDRTHVTYVWFDALVNYISVLYRENQEKTFWPCDVHLIGKDILRPHAVFWPIMLYAMGLELPKKIVAHGWWTVKGEKMSKSKGNVLAPSSIVKNYGLDAFRYFLLREIPFGADGVFSEDQLVQRINSELSNDFGNFVSRSLGMLHKYCQGKVPSYLKEMTVLEKDIDCLYHDVVQSLDESMHKVSFSVGLEAIMKYIRRMNRYVEEVSPWILAKEEKNQQRLNDVMAYLIEAICRMSFLMKPFVPQTIAKIEKTLGVVVQDKGTYALLTGSTLCPIEPLFPRINND